MKTVVVTCVGYADFLAVTLPYTMRLGWQVLIVTGLEDSETVSLWAKNLVPGLAITVKDFGPTFDKGRVLGEVLERVEGVVLVLDADIVIPPGLVIPDPGEQLLGCRRVMIRSKEEFEKWSRGEEIDVRVDRDRVGIGRGRVVDSCWGYFHLFNNSLARERGIKYQGTGTAAGYDEIFRNQWTSVGYCSGCVLHLGEERVNWKGRVSQRW